MWLVKTRASNLTPMRDLGFYVFSLAATFAFQQIYYTINLFLKDIVLLALCQKVGDKESNEVHISVAYFFLLRIA
jgi:hypothetical protein